MLNRAIKYYLLLILILLIFVPIAFANQKPFQLKNQFITTQWTTENGLPQNTVNSIIQTRDGYIWVATFGGLARFDGIKFTIFNSSNTPVLQDTRIIFLNEDFEGILWITTEYGVVYYYENETFTKFEAKVGDEKKSYYFLDRDKDGSVWIQRSNSVKKYAFKKGEPSNKILKNFPIKISSQITTTSVFDKNILWYYGGTDIKNNLFGIDTETSKEIKTDNLPTTYEVHKISLNNKNGGIWLITDNAVGIISNNKFKPMYTSIIPEYIDSSFITDEEDNVWCITSTHIYKIADGEVKKSEIKDFTQAYVIQNIIDKEGNIWVGTAGEGLYRLKKSRIRTYGLAKNNQILQTYSVIEASDGTIWIGTDNLLSIKNNEIKAEWSNENFKESEVRSLALDKNDGLLLGTTNGVFEFFGEKFKRRENIFTNDINTIYVDKQNDLWVGTFEGLISLKDKKNKLYTVKNGLVNNQIHFIKQTRNADLWIGTVGGLSRFRDGEFTNFTTKDGLSNNNIRDIFEDVDGTLWIGTYGGGINRFRNGKLVSITSKDGLAEDISSAILLDDDDNFWILGNKGVYSVSRQSLNDFADNKINLVFCSVYDTNDGMISDEGNGPYQHSGWKAKDGTLWFTMVKGAIAIDPKSNSKIPPKVYIEDVFVDDNKVDKSQELSLDYNQEDVEISYTGLNFTKPENVQFRYKLDGRDKDWNFVGTRRTVYFPFIPSGQYTFKVQALSPGGVWSENEASILITVNSPFWQKWWFYLLCSLLVFGVVIGVYQLRLKRVEVARLKQREFSRQLINAHETERRRIAVDLHDSLGQSLLVIKNWTANILKTPNIPEKVQSHLEETLEISTVALEETRTISQNLMPRHLKNFGLTNTIEKIILQFNTATEIKIDFEIDKIDDLFTSQDELSIFRVIQECLNNIAKHSQTSSANVLIERHKKLINILVEDFGKGFDTTKHLSSSNKNQSFGLNNIVQRINLLDGKLDIKSKINQGTKIAIEIPIKNEIKD